MGKVLFQNVTVVDRQSTWNGQQADVLVVDGVIEQIAPAHTVSHDATDTRFALLEGGCLSPGWVDMRCQLSDPGYEDREDLDSLAAAGIFGGFTTLVTQPNSLPVQDNAGQIKALVHRAAALPIHLAPMGALSLGAQGKDMAELYDMHQSGAVAFTDGRKGTQSAGMLLRSLQYVQPFGGVVVQSPMDQNLAEGESVAESPSAVRMGMKGIPAMAEAMMIERDLSLLALSKGKLHIGPITTAEGVALIRAAKSKGLPVTAETSALYLLLDATENENFDEVTKVYPPLRERASVLALRAAVIDGTIDVVSSSHHPQTREDKMHDFTDAAFGVDTLETAFGAIMTALKDEHFELETVIAALSTTPRQILGLPAATIIEGGLAELTHFDPKDEWIPKWVHIHSKCKWNPLAGRLLQGKASAVYVKGQLR